MSFPRAITIGLATILTAAAVQAGTLQMVYATATWSQSQYDDVSLMQAKSKAKYVGPWDAADNSWGIHADVNDSRHGGLGSWTSPHHAGPGGNGVGDLYTGREIVCALNCGASPEIDNCVSSSSTQGTSFRVRGAAFIYHQFSPEIASPMYYDGSLSCNPDQPDDSPDGPWEQSDSGSPTPIVLQLERGRLALTGLDDPVTFDVDGDGDTEVLSWTAGDYEGGGFLVFDRDGNGRIDDGRELFGAATEQPPSASPNGFAALGVLDDPKHGGDGDGKFDRDDAAFADVAIWYDRDHDGVSDPGELVALAATTVDSIALETVISERRDRYGNRFRWASRVAFSDRGQRLAAIDVVFLTSE